jgi:phospholipase C
VSTRTPIKHFVFLMQANRSFDNYFGTRPGVDGVPPGTCIPRQPGKPKPCVKPFHQDPRRDPSLPHGAAAFAEQYNGGRMDGFVAAAGRFGDDGAQVMAYHDARDLAFHWNVADDYVLFDRFFSSSHSGSLQNHLYAISGTPGTARELLPEEGFDARTIFDALQERGIKWKLYIEGYDPRVNLKTVGSLPSSRRDQLLWAPLLAFPRFIDNPSLSSRIVDLREYYEDVERGELPAVSFIATKRHSEHPPYNLEAAQTFLRGLIDTLMTSQLWDHSAFMWTYDDWGGWYDHVKPPQVDEFGYGFRVPALLVSPYAKRGYVDSTTLDFTSVLRFVQHNWGLPPLAERDRRAETFLSAFDFTAQPRQPLAIPLTHGVAPKPRPETKVIFGLYGLTIATFLTLLFIAHRTTQPRRLPTSHVGSL